MQDEISSWQNTLGKLSKTKVRAARRESEFFWNAVGCLGEENDEGTAAHCKRPLLGEWEESWVDAIVLKADLFAQRVEFVEELDPLALVDDDDLRQLANYVYVCERCERVRCYALRLKKGRKPRQCMACSRKDKNYKLKTIIFEERIPY